MFDRILVNQISIFFLFMYNYCQRTSDICVEYMENSISFERKLKDIDSFIYITIIIVN